MFCKVERRVVHRYYCKNRCIYPTTYASRRECRHENRYKRIIDALADEWLEELEKEEMKGNKIMSNEEQEPKVCVSIKFGKWTLKECSNCISYEGDQAGSEYVPPSFCTLGKRREVSPHDDCSLWKWNPKIKKDY